MLCGKREQRILDVVCGANNMLIVKVHLVKSNTSCFCFTTLEDRTMLMVVQAARHMSYFSRAAASTYATLLLLLLVPVFTIASEPMTSNNDLRSYSVVAHIPDNSTIAVVIDNDEHHLHPLRHASNVNTHLLYTGEAPRPTNCYSYVIMKDGIITQREPSTRSISGTSSSSTTTTTTYDFFDRVPKIEHVAQLPRLYGPLFKEKPNELHKPGQIATLHLTGNQDDFDTLHKRYQEQIKIEVSMSYIG